ncbi:hypothetical protein HYV82_01615, partial [Candidatus Woesearchaeota archaeon]|nr:hypothetical protein [Candidatus Woesearchaeota archaeon]
MGKMIIFILILAIALSTAAEARVVGEITDNKGKFFGPPDHICDDVNTASDALKVESGGQQASWDCQTGSSPHRPYYRIGADEGTHTFTLTPPSGYECDTWGVNYPYGGATNTGGTGCAATITALNGEWSTHLWFFVKVPVPAVVCKDNDGDKYDNCLPKTCGTGNMDTAGRNPSCGGKTQIPECSMVDVGSCKVKVCPKGWDEEDNSCCQYGSYQTGSNYRNVEIDDAGSGGDCDDDILLKNSWSVSGSTITINSEARKTDAGHRLGAGFTIEAANCQFSDGSVTKEE